MTTETEANNVRDRVLALYPDAICEDSRTFNGRVIWQIHAGSEFLAFTFQNEEVAWKNALSIANRKIIQILES